MITIDNKSLNYVQGKNLCFVVKVKNTSINCDCGNCNTNIKSFKVKVLFETEVIDKELYNIYEYHGVKVFVLNSLKVIGDIHVYQKAKIPFIEPTFGIKGIES